MTIQTVLSQLVRLVFPAYCSLCRTEGTILCDDCVSTLDSSGVFFCPGCHMPQHNGVHCGNCHSSLDAHIALYQYDIQIASIIKALKYHYQEAVLRALAGDIGLFSSQIFRDRFDAIVPVPLHKRRFAERGFNQARLIAEIIADELQSPIKKLLARTVQTKKQSTLSAADRQQNISADSFIYRDKARDINSVLLVDDVFTTGATMQAAAKKLKQHGVRHVAGFSLARAIDA